MYVFKNAIKNISNFRSKNILMFSVILIMSILCCLSLTVWFGARKYEKNNTSMMNISVDFGQNQSQLIFNFFNTAKIYYKGMGIKINDAPQSTSESTMITTDYMRSLIESNDDILAYDIVYTRLTGSENFKSYALDSDADYLNLTQNKVLTAFSDRQYVNISNSDQIEKLFYAEETFDEKLEYYAGSADRREFIPLWLSKDVSAFPVETGEPFEISSGEMFDNESTAYECVIDAQLANVRNIKPGDTINVYLNDYEYTLHVTGIYKTKYIKNYMEKYESHAGLVTQTKPIRLGDKKQSSGEYYPSIYVNDSFYEIIKPQTGEGTYLNFFVHGVSSDKVMEDFIYGSKIITYGKVFDPSSAAYECLISEELALKNGVKVGDEITLRGCIKGSKDYPIKIVGIYAESDSLDDYNKTTVHSSNYLTSNGVFSVITTDVPLDEIYMSYPAVMDIIDDIDSYTAPASRSRIYPRTFNLRLFFANPRAINDLYFDLKDVDYEIAQTLKTGADSTQAYFSQLMVIKRTTSYAMATFIISIIITIVFLVMFNAYNMRERQYEIGVLTSMGMPKKKIALQFISEILIVVFAATLIGTGIGVLSSGKVSNYLTTQNIENIQEYETLLASNFGREVNLPETETVQDMRVDTAITPVMLFGLWGMFIFVSVISTRGVVNFILCSEPIAILNNRN